MLSEFSKASLLYDFYGDLLQERQREIYSLYYEENYTLAEIAEIFDMTRQGIHEAIKRMNKRLETFENKLGLLEKFEHNEKALLDVVKKLDLLIEKDKGNKQLIDIKKKLNSLIEFNS